MKRFFAWAGILIIAAVFLALIVLTFTGGPENVILALLFCVIVIPVMLYGYALILKYVRNRNKKMISRTRNLSPSFPDGQQPPQVSLSLWKNAGGYSCSPAL